jgi:hypothetical protein
MSIEHAPVHRTSGNAPGKTSVNMPVETIYHSYEHGYQAMATSYREGEQTHSSPVSSSDYEQPHANYSQRMQPH